MEAITTVVATLLGAILMGMGESERLERLHERWYWDREWGIGPDRQWFSLDSFHVYPAIGLLFTIMAFIDFTLANIAHWHPGWVIFGQIVLWFVFWQIRDIGIHSRIFVEEEAAGYEYYQIFTIGGSAALLVWYAYWKAGLL